MKITISTILMASLLRSAADALKLASSHGLDTITFNKEMTLTNFLRFCLGRAFAEWK